MADMFICGFFLYSRLSLLLLAQSSVLPALKPVRTHFQVLRSLLKQRAKQL